MIYIAGPFFTEEEVSFLQQMIEYVKQKHPNEELWIPMEHNAEGVEGSPKWCKEVFLQDVAAIDKADSVVALYLGMYSDTGTAWEIGYAYAKQKHVELYIPDEKAHLGMSLMPVNSCTTCTQPINEIDQV